MEASAVVAVATLAEARDAAAVLAFVLRFFDLSEVTVEERLRLDPSTTIPSGAYQALALCTRPASLLPLGQCTVAVVPGAMQTGFVGVGGRAAGRAVR